MWCCVWVYLAFTNYQPTWSLASLSAFLLSIIAWEWAWQEWAQEWARGPAGGRLRLWLDTVWDNGIRQSKTGTDFTSGRCLNENTLTERMLIVHWNTKDCREMGAPRLACQASNTTRWFKHGGTGSENHSGYKLNKRFAKIPPPKLLRRQWLMSKLGCWGRWPGPHRLVNTRNLPISICDCWSHPVTTQKLD